MLSHWKKLLVIFIFVGIIYGGCNTRGILKTEEFFRTKNPNMSMTPKVCYMLGTSAFRTFRYKLAIEIINRNLKDYPYESAAVVAEYRRAVSHEKLGEYRMAISLYEKFLYDHPKDNRYNAIQNKVSKLKALHLEE